MATMVYWQVKARGWPAAVVAREGGVNLKWDADTANAWPSTKDKAPFGQLPYVTIDGHTYAQSGAIYRILARKGKLEGANDHEFALNQELIEEYQDIVAALGKTMYTKEDKTAAWAETEKSITQQLHFVEKLLGSSGRFTESKLCVGDVLMVCIIDILNNVFGASFVATASPKLAKFFADNNKIIAADAAIGHYYKK